MHRTQLIGATLAARPAGAGRARGPRHGVDRRHRVRVEPDSAGHRSRRPRGSLTPRFFAMTHIAMFDAINAHRARVRRPIASALRHWGGGSPEAAAAQAAHDVLVVINPAATATYDAALARQLGDEAVGLRPPRRGRRRPCRQGDAGVAAERRLGGLAVSSRIPSRCCRGAGSRRRRTTRPRRSRIFRTPRRWPC